MMLCDRVLFPVECCEYIGRMPFFVNEIMVELYSCFGFREYQKDFSGMFAAVFLQKRFLIYNLKFILKKYFYREGELFLVLL